MSLCSQLKKSVATSWSPSTQPPEFLWKTCTSFEAIPCMRENLLSVFWPITTKLPDRAPKSFSSTAWQVSPWLRSHRGRHVGHTFDPFMKQEIDVVFGHTKLEVSSVSAMSISMYTVVLFSAFIFVSFRVSSCAAPHTQQISVDLASVSKCMKFYVARRSCVLNAIQ